MQSFELPLSNGGTVTGIHSLPSASPLEHRPLIVGLHGGTYRCTYFDANPTHTASIASSAFGVPFVSIDRPCYGGTSSFLPLPSDSTFPRESGFWIHHYILPAIWSAFGKPNNCNSIVLLCHSLGVMGGVAAAALHAQDSSADYPLAGIIFSGLGDHLLPEMQKNPIQGPNVSPDHVSFPLDVKDSLMFRPGTVHPEVLNLTAQLDSPAPFAELESLRKHWLVGWRDDWAKHVNVPVMLGLSEQDCFFVGTRDHLEHIAAAFENSLRVDGSLLNDAPHCIELSRWSQGWYSRCFGFAMECSVNFAIGN